MIRNPADIISEATEETLHLEFKTLSDSSGERIVKDDRRVLARAICGMANAEGGTIIVGVETKRVDNVDIAISAKPIGNVERLRNLLVAAIPEMLSPQCAGIEVEEGEGGILIIKVPRSDVRPHYSNVHHQYFRRGSDGTRVLEHAEIRELMLAVRQGSLSIDWLVRELGNTGDLRFNLSIILSLSNTGLVPVIAPYLRLTPSGWRPPGLAHVSSRRSADGSTGIYGSRDLIVHVQDDVGLAEVGTGLDFRRTGQFELRAALHSARINGPNCFVMAPFHELPIQPGFTTADRPISVKGLYGAENVPAANFEFTIGKLDLLNRFCLLRNH